MPLVFIKEVACQALLGVWKIEESADTLKKQVQLSAEEEGQYVAFKSDARKKQWLSCRILLKEMVKPEPPFIEYDEFGKPRLMCSELQISMSHSGDFSSVITCKTVPVGVDIERLKDRIFRISDKFLSPGEIEQMGTANMMEKHYIAWGAKESLYKLYGKPDLEFKRDIIIDAFDYLCSGIGQCEARVITPVGVEKHPVFYELISEYMLVYALKT